METVKKIPVIVYAESTPNPAAMKFVANKVLIQNSAPLEFFSSSEAKVSPLAMELFKFPFVKSVFISANYITVFKTELVQWEEVVVELREFIRNYLAERKMVVYSETLFPDASVVGEQKMSEPVQHAFPVTEAEKKIVEVLEQYVMPAVEQDGGMIVFHSFKDGTVYLTMRGACSGCPSSQITLKAGIEALLKKFVPEVKEVVHKTDTAE